MRASFLLILLLAYPALASEPIASKIHTYGFPLSVAGEDLDDLLRQIAKAFQNLDPSAASSLDNLAKCDTLDCILRDPKARELIERSLGEGGLNIGGLRDVPVEELLDMVDDPQLRETLSEMIQAGNLTSKEAQGILEFISKSYMGGALSTRGYMAALEAVRRVTERNLTLARNIEVEQLQTIKRVLLQNDLMRDVAQKLAETSVQRPSFPTERASYFTMPSLRIPIIPILLLAAVLLTVPLAFFLFKSLNLERKVRITLASLSPPEVGARRGSIVALYWEAVRFVEIVTGRRKEDSTTHREYLAAVKGHEVEEPFKEITHAYEQVRFGGRGEEELKGSVADSMERIRRAG
ncbi:MAG: DUF4129 domain-containing protein [Acidilobaceae archaeon]